MHVRIMSPEVRKKIAYLYAHDGLTIAMLKERFGYGYERISKALDEENVKRREPGTGISYDYSSSVP